MDETHWKGTVCTWYVCWRLGCRRSKRQQKQKLNKPYMRKIPALAAFIHLASNVLTCNSCWLSSSCQTSLWLLCCYLSPWHATTNSNGCRVGVARHKLTFTPFQIHCSFTGTGFAPVLPTGNFHFSSWQLNTGKQGGMEPKRRWTKMVMAQKKSLRKLWIRTQGFDLCLLALQQITLNKLTWRLQNVLLIFESLCQHF